MLWFQYNEIAVCIVCIILAYTDLLSLTHMQAQLSSAINDIPDIQIFITK